MTTTSTTAAIDDSAHPGRIAIVVLNYNKKPDLLEALESIYASDYPDFKVVVVDNDSTDGSADAVEENFPQAHLIRNPENTGVSMGRNTGWRYADENYDSSMTTRSLRRISSPGLSRRISSIRKQGFWRARRSPVSKRIS
jgi:glycosyltransferase involved in cell wall biosynthesis